MKWLEQIKKSWRGATPTKRRDRYARLFLEPLEPRCVPAVTFTWSGAGANTNWSNAQNWVGNVAPAFTSAQGDVLVFPTLAAGRSYTSNNDIAHAVVDTISFTNAGYTLNGNAVVLNHASGGLGGTIGMQVPTGGYDTINFDLYESVTFTATFAKNATTLTPSSMNGLAVGETLSGTGISGGTTITGVGATTITISAGTASAQTGVTLTAVSPTPTNVITDGGASATPDFLEINGNLFLSNSNNALVFGTADSGASGAANGPGTGDGNIDVYGVIGDGFTGAAPNTNFLIVANGPGTTYFWSANTYNGITSIVGAPLVAETNQAFGVRLGVEGSTNTGDEAIIVGAYTQIDLIGDFTTGSNQIVNVTSITGVAVGAILIDNDGDPGTDFPDGTYVTAISGPVGGLYTITVSNAALTTESQEPMFTQLSGSLSIDAGVNYTEDQQVIINGVGPFAEGAITASSSSFFGGHIVLQSDSTIYGAWNTFTLNGSATSPVIDVNGNTLTIIGPGAVQVISGRQITDSAGNGNGNSLRIGDGTAADGGTLIFNGSLVSGSALSIIVANGGILAGVGTLATSTTISVQGGGIVMPGDPNANGGIGTLTVSKISFNFTGATLYINMGGTNSAPTNSKLKVTGRVTMNSSRSVLTLDETALSAPTNLPIGSVNFDVLDYGSLNFNGAFASPFTYVNPNGHNAASTVTYTGGTGTAGSLTFNITNVGN